MRCIKCRREIGANEPTYTRIVNSKRTYSAVMCESCYKQEITKPHLEMFEPSGLQMKKYYYIWEDTGRFLADFPVPDNWLIGYTDYQASEEGCDFLLVQASTDGTKVFPIFRAKNGVELKRDLIPYVRLDRYLESDYINVLNNTIDSLVYLIESSKDFDKDSTEALTEIMNRLTDIRKRKLDVSQKDSE